jgi:DNA-directed RNA polymerase specialized sigma24 family protein
MPLEADAAARLRCKVFGLRPPAQAVAFDPEPETICYRGQALALVRHFFEMSSQLGRLPSILGREFFRAKVSHHGIPSFEDRALFLHDVQQSLLKLNDEELAVLTLVGLYDLSHEEAAAMLHCSCGCVSQRYAEALARLTHIFLDAGVLRRDRPDRRQLQMKGRELPSSALPPKKPCGTVRRSEAGQIRQVRCSNA